MTTARLSRKGKLLRQGERVSLCVQSEEPPYKYASIEGPIVAIEAADTDHDTRHLAHRYLGQSAATTISQRCGISCKAWSPSSCACVPNVG